MSESIIFNPSFTGEALWYRGKATGEPACKTLVPRAIYRNNYHELRLCFGPEAHKMGAPDEILMTWSPEENCFEWGKGTASCQLRPDFPDAASLSGSWFLHYDAKAEGWPSADPIDLEEVDIEEAVDTALRDNEDLQEEYRLRVTLSPLEINVS